MHKSALTVIWIVLVAAAPSLAISIGGPGGTWPKTWPKELEPLREQASTWTGGLANNVRYEIPFTDREQFEAAWPHILKVKGQGASISLMDGPRYFGAEAKHSAGVMILMPPKGATEGSGSKVRIVLFTDGKVIDLNRIKLPNDTPIDDRRFDHKNKKPAAKKNPASDDQPAVIVAPAAEGK